MKKTINILDLLQNIMGAKLAYLIEPSKSYYSYTGNFSITNLSRWTLSMSKRRLERFYARPHAWSLHSADLIIGFLSRTLLRVTGFNSDWVLACDETVDKKSGYATHGIGYAYSSKAEKVIKSVSVMNLSVVHRTSKLSLPLIQEQLIYPTELTEKAAAKKAAKKAATLAAKLGVVAPSSAPKGRQKGSKNKPKEEKSAENQEIAYTFQVLTLVLDLFLNKFKGLLSPFIQVKYLVGDGGFGNNTVAKICLDKGLSLISKLQYNAALYAPFEGEYSGKGAPRKYGLKLNFDTLATHYKDALVEIIKQKDGSIDHVYHLKKRLHKSFDMPLNVVVILKYDKYGQAKSHKSRAVLFSTDLNADHKTIMDIYQVRYQIEFNFRDARQFFGLSNFKNIKKQQVQNVIGYAFFMVTLSNILLFEIKQNCPQSKLSIQDIKAYFRAEKYLNELLNKDEFIASYFLSTKRTIDLPIIGAINPF